MDNVSTSVKEPRKNKLLKNKSFLSRLSSSLLRNQLYRHAKFKKGLQGDTSERTSDISLTQEHETEDVCGNTENDHVRPGYATVCDIIQEDESSDEAPPLPTKCFDDLYSTVRKKVYADIGCNTDDVDFTKFKYISSDTHMKDDDVHSQQQISEPIPTLAVPNLASTPRNEGKQKRLTETLRSLNREKSTNTKSYRSMKKMMLRHKEELEHLRGEMQKILLRNESLQKQVKELLEQEQNWKEEISKAMISQQDHLNTMANNYELNEQITRLELETKQEVQLLCEKVTFIKGEKDRLLEEVHALNHENELLQQMCDKTHKEKINMISVHAHSREIKNHQRREQELKEKCDKEVADLQKFCKKIEDEKINITIEISLLTEERKKFQIEILNLTKRQEELIKDQKVHEESLKELKEKEHKASDLELAMSNTIQNITGERDTCIKEMQFLQGEYKELQTFFEKYCDSLGSLDKIVENADVRITSELQAAKMKAQVAELNNSKMENLYEKQLDALRTKVVEKNTAINNLKRENRMLRSDFERLWQFSCEGTNPDGRKKFTCTASEEINE